MNNEWCDKHKRLMASSPNEYRDRPFTIFAVMESLLEINLELIERVEKLEKIAHSHLFGMEMPIDLSPDTHKDEQQGEES